MRAETTKSREAREYCDTSPYEGGREPVDDDSTATGGIGNGERRDNERCKLKVKTGECRTLSTWAVHSRGETGNNGIGNTGMHARNEKTDGTTAHTCKTNTSKVKWPVRAASNVTQEGTGSRVHLYGRE